MPSLKATHSSKEHVNPHGNPDLQLLSACTATRERGKEPPLLLIVLFCPAQRVA